MAQKGFDTLLRAWRRVDQRRDWAASPELVLVGDGPQRPRLETLVGRLGLARHRAADRCGAAYAG